MYGARTPGAVAPGFVDGPLKEVPAQTQADETLPQPKMDHFDFSFSAPVQLGKTSWDTIGH